jgi:two-component system sensor histidine kinase TctE
VTTRPAPSLRRSLLINLLVPTTVLGVALGFAGLLLIDRTIETAYDRVLDGSVKAIAERVTVEDGEISVDLPQVALGMLETQANDSVYYSVSYGGSLVTGYKDLPSVDMTSVPVGTIKHFVSQYKGVPIRMSAMAESVYGKPLAVLVEVAETVSGRTAARQELLLVLAVLEIAMIVTAGVLVWLAVRRGLASLVELGHAIDARRAGTATDLEPLNLDGIPREAHPPVRAMNELLGRLDAAIEVIRNFIGDASHQMKTPLASLRVHVALLRREITPGRESSETLAEIERSTSHLDRLAAQLIAMARAEQASIDEDNANEKLADLVGATKDVVSTMAPLAATRNVELALEAETAVAQVRVAPSTLHDILTNLIDNAIRYNVDAGSVVVTVRAGDRHHSVSIADSGPGIAPEHRQRVFDRFYRIPGSGRSAGSGLGLSIVRSLVQRSAGTITFSEGIGGRGLCLTVSLPT